MLIQGSFSPIEIVERFIEREYAFVCHWDESDDMKELRIAHHKGTWLLIRMYSGLVFERFEITDAMTIETNNELLRGLFEAKIKLIASKKSSDIRVWNAEVILSLLRFWVGDISKITRIDVLKDCRNSWMDYNTTEFSFSN